MLGMWNVTVEPPPGLDMNKVLANYLLQSQQLNVPKSGAGALAEIDSWRGSRSCLRKSRAYLTRYVPSLDTPALSGSHAKIRTKLRRSSEQIIFCLSMTFIWSHFYPRFFFMRNERRGGEQSGKSAREIDGQPCRAPRGVFCTAVSPSCG